MPQTLDKETMLNSLDSIVVTWRRKDVSDALIAACLLTSVIDLHPDEGCVIYDMVEDIKEQFDDLADELDDEEDDNEDQD